MPGDGGQLKSIIPVVMAGVLGIYGHIIAVIIANGRAVSPVLPEAASAFHTLMIPFPPCTVVRACHPAPSVAPIPLAVAPPAGAG